MNKRDLIAALADVPDDAEVAVNDGARFIPLSGHPVVLTLHRDHPMEVNGQWRGEDVWLDASLKFHSEFAPEEGDDGLSEAPCVAVFE